MKRRRRRQPADVETLAPEVPVDPMTITLRGAIVESNNGVFVVRFTTDSPVQTSASGDSDVYATSGAPLPVGVTTDGRPLMLNMTVWAEKPEATLRKAKERAEKRAARMLAKVQQTTPKGSK
jgi:hypothetical protein